MARHTSHEPSKMEQLYTELSNNVASPHGEQWRKDEMQKWLDGRGHKIRKLLLEALEDKTKTVLHIAAKHANLRVCRFILEAPENETQHFYLTSEEKKALVQAISRSGRTLFHHAARCGVDVFNGDIRRLNDNDYKLSNDEYEKMYTHFTRYVLKQSEAWDLDIPALLNVKDAKKQKKKNEHVIEHCGGWTALMAAAYRGRSTMTELLLEYGADLKIRNARGLDAIKVLNGAKNGIHETCKPSYDATLQVIESNTHQKVTKRA